MYEPNLNYLVLDKGIKPWKCDTCDAEFARKAHLRRHTESIHQGISRRKPYSCDKCQFTCYKKSTFQKHKKGSYFLLSCLVP